MWERYGDVVRLIQIGKDRIDTQNIIFADLRLITEHGYRLFIHPQIGEPFEITLGKCDNTKREIKPETNILHLLLSGEFDTEDCKVVEEVL
jgi:hypothetical protein